MEATSTDTEVSDAQLGEEVDLHYEPLKEPELSPQVLLAYEDCKQLLFQGFLTTSATIGGISYTFKTVNHHEFHRIRWMVGSEVPDQKYYLFFLAFGVFYCNGVNLLKGDRDESVYRTASIFEALPEEALRKVVLHVSEFNRRAATATLLTEAYALEQDSRYRWLQHRGVDLTSPSVTGIEGTQHLGMNYAQLAWRALNFLEDQYEQQERDWSNAKFVGSCMVGKGITKIHNQDQKRREAYLKDRWSKKEAVIRQALCGESPQQSKKRAHAVMTGAHTLEDLTEQMKRTLRGEKDWHDQVVAELERTAKVNYQEQQLRIQEMQQASTDEPALVGAERKLQFFTKEEAEEFLQDTAKSPTGTVASVLLDPKEAPRIHTWMSQIPSPD